MAMIKRRHSGDVLFLQTVKYEHEKLPRGKVRMLYLDARGNVFASIMSRSVYESAVRGIQSSSQHPRAVIGLKSVSGNLTPVTVRISQEEAWALERILEHTLSIGQVPDILKKYIAPIINYGSHLRDTVAPVTVTRRKQKQVPATPEALERLPYYREDNLDVSMPLYKARYAPPLVVLKRLKPDDNVPAGKQRLLILDREGDMAVITVPTMLVRKMELEMIQEEKQGVRSVRAVLESEKDSFTVNYLPVTREQQRSLEVLTRNYEQTGDTRQHVSVAVKTVLSKARR